MKFSKLYAFGDSFTMGSGIRKDAVEEHYRYGGKYNDYVWVNLLGDRFKVEYKNHGIGGLGNENIQQTLITQMQNFDDNSLIVVGLTAPARLSHIFTSNEQHWSGFTIVPTIYDEWVKSKGENLKGYNNLLTQEEIDAFMTYYGTLFPKHDNAHWNYYAYSFIQLQNYFLKHNHNFIIWDYTLWPEFEVIHNWSNKELNDLHWSPNGHAEFADFLEYCIRLEFPYASYDELVLWRKGEGSKLEREYLPYY